MIPEGWTSATLEEISDPHASIRYGVVQIGTHTPGGVPIVPIKYIDRIDKVPLHLASSKIEGKYKNSRVQAGDVLISVKGTIGEVGIVPLGFNGNIAREIARIRPNGKVDAGYLAYQLQAPETQRRIKSVTVGTTRLEFSIAAVKSFEVALPPLNEQRRIAEILSTWDGAIETVEALIANAREQKKALMEQLLTGRRRLPGFSDPWKDIRLGDAFNERLERGEDGLTLLSVTQANGIIPQDEAGRRNISSEDQSNYKTVRAGDIAYNTMRMWQGASAHSDLTGKVSPAYTVITPRTGHDAKFYSYLFKQPRMINVFERHSQGLVSDTWNLKYPLFAKIRVIVPNLDEQRAIAAVFRSIDDLALSKNAQLQTLRQEKSALMQQLLTGKRRVILREKETV